MPSKSTPANGGAVAVTESQEASDELSAEEDREVSPEL